MKMLRGLGELVRHWRDLEMLHLSCGYIYIESLMELIIYGLQIYSIVGLEVLSLVGEIVVYD